MRDEIVTTALKPGDMRYPSGLHQLRLPRQAGPPTLYVRGIFPIRPLVAIVGSRDPCARSKTWARQLARDLASDGWLVASGGAEGIDTAAHLGALDAERETLVVTAGGLDGPLYPPKNQRLFEEVLRRDGAIASLDPDGSRHLQPDFLRRNSALAAIAHAVVAVELKPNPQRWFSGTGHMARAALAFGRTVMTLAHAPWSKGGAGAVYLLSQGAVPVASSADVRAVLQNRTRLPVHPPAAVVAEQLAMAPALLCGDASHASRSCGAPPFAGMDMDPAPPPLELGDDERAVIAALTHGPGHVDDVCQRTGLDVPAVRRALLISSLVGVVTESPSGMFARAPCG